VRLRGRRIALCSPQGAALHMAESPIATAQECTMAVAHDDLSSQSPSQQQQLGQQHISPSAAERHLLGSMESPFGLSPSVDISVASSPPAPDDHDSCSASRLSAELPVVYGADGSYEWGSPDDMRAFNQGASKWRRLGTMQPQQRQEWARAVLLRHEDRPPKRRDAQPVDFIREVVEDRARRRVRDAPLGLQHPLLDA
jgi:hypothetical protein